MGIASKAEVTRAAEVTDTLTSEAPRAGRGEGSDRSPAADGERPGLVDRLWHSRSVRVQLLFVFILIDLVAACLAGGITVLKARAAADIEIAASMRVAELLVSEAIKLLDQEPLQQRVLSSLPLQGHIPRHVRIVVEDAEGVPVMPFNPQRSAAGADERAPAPAWFAALIAPPIETHRVPVTVSGRRIGTVLIASEPGDEIAEAWENARALAWVALIVNLAVIGVLYLSIGHVLGPLTGLARGLLQLERRDYAVRLARPKARELANITDRFNALAEALAAALSENARLNRRLLTVQDDERRSLARDLHDEVGPCLFGLRASAAPIANLADASSAAAAAKIKERIADMLAIIEHLQSLNRSLLNRLQPMALGHVPLCALIDELVKDRARQHATATFSFEGGVLARTYGDSTDLTIYRCAQEAITNAVRHAKASHIVVSLGEQRLAAPGEGDGFCLALTVSDDGIGIAADAPTGFGLAGMRERVQALGGDYGLETTTGKGTCIRINIPLQARAQDMGAHEAEESR